MTTPTLTEFVLKRASETQIRVFDGINHRTGGAEWRDVEIMKFCHAARMIAAGAQSEYASGRVASHELRQIAAIYADHPDYRAEWKP